MDIDETRELAIDVRGEFEFESAGKEEQPITDEGEKAPISEATFSLHGIDLQIPRGALVCVVGRVGTGKTALLSGLINEMRQSSGHACFGDRVCYGRRRGGSAQGSPSAGVGDVRHDPGEYHLWPAGGSWTTGGGCQGVLPGAGYCAVVPGPRVSDVLLLVGEAEGSTKVGERGITLSGGQRQRICLARAAYDRASVVLLDDPLSAVDARVGHHILHKCILSGPLAGRTRVLVTHHLDLLHWADWVVMMDREGEVGRVIQQGTYSVRPFYSVRQDADSKELRTAPGAFRSLMEEYGSASGSQTLEVIDETAEGEVVKVAKDESSLEEDREVGEVAWSVYTGYLKKLGGWYWTSGIAAALVMGQAAAVANSLFLGF